MGPPHIPHVDSIPHSRTLHTTNALKVEVEDTGLSWSESTRKAEDTLGKLEPGSIADWSREKEVKGNRRVGEQLKCCNPPLCPSFTENWLFRYRSAVLQKL